MVPMPHYLSEMLITRTRKKMATDLLRLEKIIVFFDSAKNCTISEQIKQ